MSEEKNFAFYKIGFAVFMLATFIATIWGYSLNSSLMNCLQKECKLETASVEEINPCEQAERQSEQKFQVPEQQVDFGKVVSLGNEEGYDVFELNGEKYYCYGCNLELKGSFCQVCDYCKNCGGNNT